MPLIQSERMSTYQKEVDRVFVEENSNILLSAVAGSGKTTMLLHLLEKVNGSALFLAFNKSIVEELEQKVKFNPRVQIRTLHSIGMSGLTSVFGNLKLNDSKTVDFCLKMKGEWECEDMPNREWWALVYQIKGLYNLFRMKMCNNFQDLVDVCNVLGVYWDEGLILKTLQIHGLASSYNRNPKVIDFTDMVYLSATDSRVTFRTPTVTFIDECQDLNEAQHLLLDKIIKNSRFVACGDRNQSIYGFSGADVKSFDRFLERQNVVELPLSVCYRCGKKIVEHANGVFNNMEAFEGSEDGEVDFEGNVMDAEEGDMVVCRNTMPLVQTFFNFLKRGKKSYIKGKDIGESLINLVNQTKGNTSRELSENLVKRLENLENELEIAGIENAKNHPKYHALEEKINIISIFTKKYYTKREVENSINEVFSDEKSGVVLSTIHKSKGLEADNVYFLNRELLPSKYAKTLDQIIQEKNLDYVARTRAKKKLVYCKIKE